MLSSSSTGLNDKSLASRMIESLKSRTSPLLPTFSHPIGGDKPTSDTNIITNHHESIVEPPHSDGQLTPSKTVLSAPSANTPPPGDTSERHRTSKHLGEAALAAGLLAASGVALYHHHHHHNNHAEQPDPAANSTDPNHEDRRSPTLHRTTDIISEHLNRLTHYKRDGNGNNSNPTTPPSPMQYHIRSNSDPPGIRHGGAAGPADTNLGSSPGDTARSHEDEDEEDDPIMHDGRVAVAEYTPKPTTPASRSSSDDGSSNSHRSTCRHHRKGKSSALHPGKKRTMAIASSATVAAVAGGIHKVRNGPHKRHQSRLLLSGDKHKGHHLNSKLHEVGRSLTDHSLGRTPKKHDSGRHHDHHQYSAARQKAHKIKKAALATGAGVVGLMVAEKEHHKQKSGHNHDASPISPVRFTRPLSTGGRGETTPVAPCRNSSRPATRSNQHHHHHRGHSSGAFGCLPDGQKAAARAVVGGCVSAGATAAGALYTGIRSTSGACNGSRTPVTATHRRSSHTKIQGVRSAEDATIAITPPSEDHYSFRRFRLEKSPTRHQDDPDNHHHWARDTAVIGGSTLLALEMARKITSSQHASPRADELKKHHRQHGLTSLLSHGEIFELLKGVSSPVTCEDARVLQNRMQRAVEMQQQAEQRINSDRQALETIEEALLQIQREESRLQWRDEESEKRIQTLEALHHYRGQESISILRNEAKRLKNLIAEIEKKVAHEENEEKKRSAEEFGLLQHHTSTERELLIAALTKLKHEKSQHISKAKEMRERIFDERRRLDILVDEHRSLEEQWNKVRVQLFHFGCSHCQKKEKDGSRHGRNRRTPSEKRREIATTATVIGGGGAAAVLMHNHKHHKIHPEFALDPGKKKEGGGGILSSLFKKKKSPTAGGSTKSPRIKRETTTTGERRVSKTVTKGGAACNHGAECVPCEGESGGQHRRRTPSESDRCCSCSRQISHMGDIVKD